MGSYDVVVVGGGAAGIAVASSLLKRRKDLSIAIVEPADVHRYQPGLTLVGGGVFNCTQINKPMHQVIPKNVDWVKQAVTEFYPEEDKVLLDDNTKLSYKGLIAAPGLLLNWAGVEGLVATLGQNGVTSNYGPHCASYTWELVKSLHSGNAVFTQPPMPIKCAGAPQKAVYLSCSEWERRSVLSDINVSFHNAGKVLFGVPEYVPVLNQYMNRYGVDIGFDQNLVAVDGRARKAWFDIEGGNQIEVEFDMLHVCPPQEAPAFVKNSPLADDGGWIDVTQETLQHTRFDNVFSLGDACSAPNAKTAAAVRKQAPVVAENLLATLEGRVISAVYDGYGSCPLTVERGKVVLAEFGFGGKLQPTFPKWLIDGTQASRLAWIFKTKLLPSIYFDLMLKGRELLAVPQHVPEDRPSASSPIH